MQKRLIFQTINGFIYYLTQSMMRSYLLRTSTLKCCFVASIPVLRFCKVIKDYSKIQVFVSYVFQVKFKITSKSLKFTCVLTWRFIKLMRLHNLFWISSSKFIYWCYKKMFNTFPGNQSYIVNPDNKSRHHHI